MVAIADNREGRAMETEREKLLDKVKALLSKTVENGCTEEEALAALAKARAWIDAFEITDAELKLTKEEGAVFRREPPGTRDPHGIKRQLATSVARFCQCKVWRDTRKEGAPLTFCGISSDAQLATWLLDHLAAFVQRELADHLITALATGADKRPVINGFVIGCASRIAERLTALIKTSEQQATGNRQALVVVKGQAITARMAQDGIRLPCGRRSRVHMDHGAHPAGRSAGERASFGRPVSGNQAALRIAGRQ